jgi:hypothetical protein
MNDPGRRRSPEEFDEDAIFADIVAHLNDPDKPELEPGADTGPADIESSDEPTEEETTEPNPESTGEHPVPPRDHWLRSATNPWPFAPPPTPKQGDEPSADPDPQRWRTANQADDEDEHFQPPPVTPLPAGDLQFWGIIAGMCGGPLLLLYLVLFNRDASSYWILGSIAIAVAGFVMLVSRLPGHHDDDDDGARL